MGGWGGVGVEREGDGPFGAVEDRVVGDDDLFFTHGAGPGRRMLARNGSESRRSDRDTRQ